MRAAASRTFWTAGSSRPIRMAMIAITTNSSIRVKPPRPVRERERVLRTDILLHQQQRQRESKTDQRPDRFGARNAVGAGGRPAPAPGNFSFPASVTSPEIEARSRRRSGKNRRKGRRDEVG